MKTSFLSAEIPPDLEENLALAIAEGTHNDEKNFHCCYP
jgi:hypothetical protein